MSSELYGLMAVAQEHQKAVEAAAAAMAEASAALARQQEAARQAAQEVSRAAASAAPSVSRAAADAVGLALADSLSTASSAASSAMREAVAPVVVGLDRSAKAAADAGDRLRRATAAFAWRWVAAIGAAAAGGAAMIVGGSWAAIGWQRHHLTDLATQEVALSREVVALQEQVADLEKRGGRVKLEKCGEQGRLCVRVDKSTAYGKDGDYYVLRGY